MPIKPVLLPVNNIVKAVNKKATLKTLPNFIFCIKKQDIGNEHKRKTHKSLVCKYEWYILWYFRHYSFRILRFAQDDIKDAQNVK